MWLSQLKIQDLDLIKKSVCTKLDIDLLNLTIVLTDLKFRLLLTFFKVGKNFHLLRNSNVKLNS